MDDNHNELNERLLKHENYVKFGIEYVDGKFNISAVVTHRTSDWGVITLDKPIPYIWLKAVRRLDAIEVFYSLDGKEYTMFRTLWMPDNCPLQVGPVAACPDGEGFTARFSDFKVKHLPDARRVEWLNKIKSYTAFIIRRLLIGQRAGINFRMSVRCLCSSFVL